MRAMKIKILIFTLILGVLFSCKKEKNTDPAVKTIKVYALSASNCYVKAAVSEKGSYDILDYGFVYSSYNFSLGIDNGTKVSLGKALATDTFSTVFSINDNSFDPTTYYIRAYIKNTKGTVYGDLLNFKLLKFSVTSVFPKMGKSGDSITITGSNFSLTPADNIVKFNTTPAKVLQATSTKLIVAVPSAIQTNYYDSYITIFVGVGNQTVNASNFTLAASISGFSPKSGTFGTMITLTGENLSGAYVKCNDEDTYVYSNSNSTLLFYIPNTIKSEKVKITVLKNNTETNANEDFVMNPVSISSVNPQRGIVGSQFTVTGVNFNPYGSNIVTIGDVALDNSYSGSSTNVSGYVPNLNSGTYDVKVFNGISTTILTKTFTVIVPKVTSFSPTSGTYGSQITIFGESLSSYSNVSMCSSDYNCTYANVVSQDSSKIIFTIPYGITAGKVKLHISSGINLTFANDFTIEPLVTTISDFTPDSGTPGTEVTINGSGFVPGYTEVKFGTVSTFISSITSTVIKVQVPSNAGSGAMKISVVVSGNTVVSDGNFTIL